MINREIELCGRAGSWPGRWPGKAKRERDPF